ncbi:MAG: hypothetical protein ACREA0_08545, partial [bacterium]
LREGHYGQITINADGAPGKPLVIRGAGAATCESISLQNRKHVHVEGLAIKENTRGYAAFLARRNSGARGNLAVQEESRGYAAVDLRGAEECVVQRCHIEAVFGVRASMPPGARNCYIADNVIQGITPWIDEAMGASGKNIGEGIELTGPGNVICFNRVSGFRDCISTMEGRWVADQICIDIYNNDISFGLDDGIEADFCMSNCRIVRNRLTNCFVGMSSQPGLGGPTYFVRNVMYNLTYVPYKLHNNSQGDVVLHNTVVKTGDGAACFTEATWSHALFRNNLAIGGVGGRKFSDGRYSNGTGLAANFVSPDTTCDFDYNGYGTVGTPFAGRIGGKEFDSLASLRANTSEKHGVQVDLNVFASPVVFPNPGLDQWPVADLRLKAQSAAVDAGVILPNINEGYAGKAPDLGAHEVGQELPIYGPRPDARMKSAKSGLESLPASRGAGRDQGRTAIIPASLIIDDGSPFFNMRWIKDKTVCKEVPISFYRELAEWTEKRGMKGIFTVVPRLAGIAAIDGSMGEYPDHTREERLEWLAMAKDVFGRRFTLTPVMLTHWYAWDVKNSRLMEEPQTENEWLAAQSPEIHLEYITESMRLMKSAGFDQVGGLSMCWSYPEQQNALLGESALRAAEKVYGLTDIVVFNNIGDKVEVMFKRPDGARAVLIQPNVGDVYK